jgi:serine/threonine protein kinase
MEYCEGGCLEEYAKQKNDL